MYGLLLVLCITTNTLAVPSHSEIYNYEINIDDVVNDHDTAEFYYNCMMEQGPCNRESALMRLFIPEALKGCDGCPEKMQPALKNYMDFLVTTDEEDFLALAAKYDEEDGIFTKLYTKQLRRSRKDLEAQHTTTDRSDPGDDDIIVMQRDTILLAKAPKYP